MRWFECEPCDHRWWEHRNPDPKLRRLGLWMMTSGVITCIIGAIEIGRR